MFSMSTLKLYTLFISLCLSLLTISSRISPSPFTSLEIDKGKSYFHEKHKNHGEKFGVSKFVDLKNTNK